MGVCAEAVAVACMRGVQHESTSRLDGLSLAAVQCVRSQKAQPGMTVMGVVRVEEADAERPRILLGGERAGEARAVLQGLELRFAVGVDAPMFVKRHQQDLRGGREIARRRG